MACLSNLQQGQTLAQRNQQVDQALARLKRYLTTGAVRLTIGANGAIAFNAWKDRDGISDVCAYRSLMLANSWELRQAVSKAEAMSDRKVNPQAIAAGMHSHDDGRTWGKH